MTPTAEWYEADADDSDRSITDDVTANTHETARAATETGETGARVRGDADLLRKRTAALDRVAAENEQLRAEVERWRTVYERANDWSWEQASRAEAAEAKLRDVEALADLRDVKYPERFAFEAAENHVRGYRAAQSDLRAALARSQAPQAPAEQEGECHVEIGGQRMTEAQYHAARYPIFHGVASHKEAERLHEVWDLSNWSGSEDSMDAAPSVRPATAGDEGVRHG